MCILSINLVLGSQSIKKSQTSDMSNSIMPLIMNAFTLLGKNAKLGAQQFQVIERVQRLAPVDI